MKPQPEKEGEVKDAYKVIGDEEACPHCNKGQTWTVEGPYGVCIGQSFGDIIDAEETAVMLNSAYEKGTACNTRPRPEVERVVDELIATHSDIMLQILNGLPKKVTCAQFEALKSKLLALLAPGVPDEKNLIGAIWNQSDNTFTCQHCGSKHDLGKYKVVKDQETVTPEAGKAVGMYGDTPRVQVGKYSICRQDDISVWIEHDEGEGGQFPDDLFEKFIEAFYNDNF